LSSFFGWGTVRAPGGDAPVPAARVGDEVVLRPDLGDLNALIERGPGAWAQARAEAEAAAERVALDAVQPVLPVRIADYVDFYASLEHATNVGRMFRPDDPLEPNWRRLPVGYHGRASTVVVSETEIVRPHGQLGPGVFGPTAALDFECELGFVCGPSTRRGERVPVERAAERIFGVVLLNDWSARDVQAWEYKPLGPFLGKSFATSISPWVVPLDAIPRVPAREQEPEPLDYLRDPEALALDVPLEVTIGDEVITRTNARTLYWTLPQMLAHATVNGATLTAGDLFGTGTISGADPASLGCLLERYRGERWLRDGEEVVISSPLLGEVRGRVAPAA
jgi:fumarylacetoacetase